MLFLCDLKRDHYIHYKNIDDDNKRVNIDVYERIKKPLRFSQITKAKH